jgi:hypothetical protein
MDKKIILVFIILLVLAIYYCYTHESFTENFENSGVGADTTAAITNLGKLAGQLLTGGAMVPGNLTVNGNISNTGTMNTGALTSGNITSGNITSGTISSGAITSSGNITSTGNISSSGNISSTGTITTDGLLTSKANIKVVGSVLDDASSIMLVNLRYGKCLDSPDGVNIKSTLCNRETPTQYWHYNGVRFVNDATGKCFTITDNKAIFGNPGNPAKFALTPCDKKNYNQVFYYDKHSTRRILWKNQDFAYQGPAGWTVQIRDVANGDHLDLWDAGCGNDCVWDAV